MANIALVFICSLCIIGMSQAEQELETIFSKKINHQAIMELRPLGTEFVQYFKNTSELSLALPDIPSQQDLVCITDVTKWISSITSGSYWALKMIDSWGSIPSGYLYGSRYDMGNYDECLNINKAISSSHSIKGKYCFMEVSLAKYVLGMDSDNLKYINMEIASCFPSSCSGKMINRLLAQLTKRLLGLQNGNDLVSINEKSCQTADREPYDGLTIFVIVLLSVFGAAVLLGTLYDYLLTKDQDPPHKIVKIFSARESSRALFRIVQPNSNSNVIDCLHGMRCMSLIWVVFGHEYIFGLIAPNLNQWAIVRWFEVPFNSFILEGFFSVDTFFFISGLLVVMIALRSMEKSKGKLNIPLMYLHRYLRLTPLVALAILVYWKLLFHLTRGPLSNQGFGDYAVCKRNWYKTLLYIQNYASKDICLPHSWYLAVDMQLYLLSPFFLIAVYKWGKKAAGGIFVLMLLLSACLFSTMLLGDLSKQFKKSDKAEESQAKLYFATHTHAAPWLIGFLFGYFLHLNRGRRFQLNRLTVWLGWVLCLGMIFTSIFALYSSNFSDPAVSALKESFYYTLTRIAWPLALCWVVFACMQGYGGLANSFLSTPLWQPLSRLSYSIYIWHCFIQDINHRRILTVTRFSDYDMMLQFWQDFGFTIIMSYVIYIAFEAPLTGLESLLIPNRKPNPQPKQDVPKVEDNQTIEGVHETKINELVEDLPKTAISESTENTTATS